MRADAFFPFACWRAWQVLQQTTCNAFPVVITESDFDDAEHEDWAENIGSEVFGDSSRGSSFSDDFDRSGSFGLGAAEPDGDAVLVRRASSDYRSMSRQASMFNEVRARVRACLVRKRVSRAK